MKRKQSNREKSAVHRHDSVPALIALLMIASTAVLLVVVGNAGAGVLTAAGGVIVGTLRLWRPGDRR